MNNIVLIGMPGSGKSTVGVVLAKRLGYDFLDVDLLISRQQNARLQNILDTRGLTAFLECEKKAGMSVVAQETVIATGGSMVLLPEAMAHLGREGTFVYLDVPLPELEKRLGNFSSRGVAMKPGQTLADIYRERRPYYEKYADVTVTVSSRSTLEDVAEELAGKLNHLMKDWIRG